MKTKLTNLIHVILPLFLIGATVHAQTILTSGSSLVIAAGGQLVTTQNLIVHNGGNLDVKGTLNLKKDLLNLNTSDDLGTGTVEFSGNRNQNLTGQNTIRNVTVSYSSWLSLGGHTTINGIMTLLNGKVTLGSNNLTLTATGTFGGTPSVNAMIIPTGSGQVFKEVAAGFAGITFPVGDTTGTEEYSPVLLSFTNLVVPSPNTALIGLNLFNHKYPDPGITGNYLNRYWTLSSNGFSSFNCNATFLYVPEDVTGTREVLSCTKVNPLPWVTYSPVQPPSFEELHANGLTSFSSFTGLRSTTTPAILELANIHIDSIAGFGVETVCYDATQILRVAGNGNTFTVQNGGRATLIAGQTIFLLPGTHVFNHGYLHGYISTDGNYCSSLPNPLVYNPEPDYMVMSVGSEKTNGGHARVYPNPTSGLFTVELNAPGKTGLTRIEIYNINGVKVMAEGLHGERKHQCAGSDFRPGIYFIRIYSEDQVETVKLIKN
jgi:hypothetical protein